MNSFISYGLRQAYDRLAKLGNPLAGVNTLIDWERFRPIAEELYSNKTEKGGHLNLYFALMIKIIVLQHWYGLSDRRMEKELANNLSFINFLVVCLCRVDEGRNRSVRLHESGPFNLRGFAPSRENGKPHAKPRRWRRMRRDGQLNCRLPTSLAIQKLFLIPQQHGSFVNH